MEINCIIIDDEPLAIKVVTNYLNEFKNFHLIGTYKNPLESLEVIENNDIDVIFLDINMPKMNGLEFIRNIDNKPLIVITTAYREYAVESYDLDVLDYLVKPIPFNRFLRTINKISQKIQLLKGVKKVEDNKDDYFFLKVEKKLMKIRFSEILYIESLKDYIKIFTKTGNFLVHKSLTSITDELPSDNFLRIHRSYTIAIDKVKSVEGNLVEIDTKRIPIGRKYVNQAKQIILN